MDPLEQAALSGALFQTHHSPSPTRSASTSSPTPSSPSSSSHNPDQNSRPPSPPLLPNSNLHNPTSQAQTGPKGVISDQRASNRLSTLQKENDLRELRYRQERAAITGLTIHEEEEIRQRELGKGDGDGLGEWRRKRLEELEEESGPGGRKKGGLKEVGRKGFVSAVERRGWVVVLIYEPDIPRCNALLASTLSLSLSLSSNSNPFSTNMKIHIYRARASNLAFSLLPTLNDDEEGEGRPDPDVLPTLLAYKDGELEKTWVRVDWDVGEDGVEGLLRKEGILGTGFGDIESRDEVKSDDDDD